MRIPLVTALFLVLLGDTLCSCGKASPGALAAQDDAGLVVTVLAEGEAEAWGQMWPYQLLKLQLPGKAPAYAQWFPPRKEGVWPTMMLTRPYDGIDWTGEEVDAKWAARGAGMHPDDSEPHYVEGSSSIVYSPASPELIAADAFFYLYHDFGVLAVFGRFYAGGDIQNDRDDMHAGMRFLAQAQGVDRSRIGIFGGSWGGFEAMYAAVDAPAEVRPKVGVALYPLTDFARQLEYADAVVPTRVSDPEMRGYYELFFEPYFRRVISTTGGPPGAPGADYGRWTREYLTGALEVPFLVIHDEWDTLVPVEQTWSLAAEAGGRVAPLYFQHPVPADWNTLVPSHGPIVDEHGSVVGTLYLGHLLTNLGGSTQQLFVPYDEAALGAWLWDVRALQQSGRDMDAVAPRLLELTDPRVQMYELAHGTLLGGAELIAGAVNAVWGTSHTADTIRTALAAGLPR